MNKIKFYLLVMSANFVTSFIRMLRRGGGTSLFGYMVLKICPGFLSYCEKYITDEKITVTGTNGKTTTAGLLSFILETNRKSVIHNEKGANMLSGIANALALAIFPLKRFDNCVIESDEAYLSKLYDNFKADYLVVTNLFRDQLDRYGELDTTAKKIREAINKNLNVRLFLNADDPIVANFSSNVEPVYFGMDNVSYAYAIADTNAPSEIFSCICSKPLQYSKRFFAQEGHYYCECGYSRPQCKYCGEAEVFEDFSKLKVKVSDKEYNFTVPLAGLYNAYNALAAISVALELGVVAEVIQSALNTYKSAFGRSEKVMLKGRNTMIQLIKNPTGASEVLKTVDLSSHIMLAINDNYADGRDMSWLWDTDFEILKNVEKPIVTSGLRAYEMANRLKYAGVPVEKIKVIPKVKKALKYVLNSAKKDEKVTILPTYTALLRIRKG